MDAQVTTQSPSVWCLLISIVDKPQQTFTDLAVNPRLKWVLPLVLAIAAALFTVWISAPHTAEMAQQASLQQLTQNGMSPTEAQKMLDQTARFRTPLFLGIVGSVTGILFLAIIWVAMAGLFYFVSLVAGAELNFGSVFTVVAWSSLPLTLRGFVQGALIAATGRFPIYTGLSALQATGDTLKDAGNPLLVLLSFVDIFWLWHIALLVIGVAVAAKFSRLKAFLIVLIYALLSIGLATGVTLLSGAR